MGVKTTDGEYYVKYLLGLSQWLGSVAGAGLSLVTI